MGREPRWVTCPDALLSVVHWSGEWGGKGRSHSVVKSHPDRSCGQAQ